MDFLPYSQEYMLIVSVMGGMFLGFIWDIYRLIRYYVKLGSIGTAVGDLVYWIISIYISIKLIFDISYGNVRFFILMGFLLGALLYFYGISNYILKLFILIIDILLRYIKRIISFMVYPLKFVVKKIKAVLYPIKLKIKKIIDKTKRRYKFFKFKLKKVSRNRKLLYNRRKHIKRINKRKRKEQKRSERRSKENNRIEKKNKS